MASPEAAESLPEAATERRFVPPVPPPPAASLPWWRVVHAFRTNVIAAWLAPENFAPDGRQIRRLGDLA